MTDYLIGNLRLGHLASARRRLSLHSTEPLPDTNAQIVAAHDKLILDRLESTMSTGDRLFLLGNITAGLDFNSEITTADCAFRRLTRLAAANSWQVHIVLGQADFAHPAQPTYRGKVSHYLDLGVTVLTEGQLTLAGHTVRLSHFPYPGAVDPSRTPHRYMPYEIPGTPLIYADDDPAVGWLPTFAGQRSALVNVSADALDLRPVAKDTVSEALDVRLNH